MYYLKVYKFRDAEFLYDFLYTLSYASQDDQIRLFDYVMESVYNANFYPNAFFVPFNGLFFTILPYNQIEEDDELAIPLEDEIYQYIKLKFLL